jgi:hypothetical protein
MLVTQLLHGIDKVLKYFYDFFCNILSWKRDANGAIIYRRMNAHDRPKPVLEFVAIQRHDTKQWALPGVNYLYIYIYSSLIISLLLLKGYGRSR